jgi:hypothetical protein
MGGKIEIRKSKSEARNSKKNLKSEIGWKKMAGWALGIGCNARFKVYSA